MGNIIPLIYGTTPKKTLNTQDESFGGTTPVGKPMGNLEPNRTLPRVYDTKAGQNLLLAPKSEIAGSIPFATLDFVAKNTDLIMIAENILLNQISSRKWDIVSSDPEDKTDYSKEVKIVQKFLKHPDKERTYCQWVRKALKNIIRYDAFCVYKRKNKKGGLYGLNIVDGKLIKILTDSNGYKLIAPQKTYQQIINGSVRGEWTSEELIYAPMSEDIVGHYGVSAVERIIVSTLKYLRKQQFDYAYFKEGAYPDGGLYSLKSNDQSQWSPEDIKMFQANWDETMSGAKERHSLKFVPDGGFQRTKDYHWDTIHEEWIGKLVCASIGVSSSAFNKQINRAVADTEDRQQTETGLNPYIRHLEDIITDVIQVDFGFEELSFKIIDEKLEDQQAKVDKNVKYLTHGAINVNEIRREEGKEPVLGGDTYSIQVGNAIVPLEAIGKAVTVSAGGTDNSDNISNMETEVRDINIGDSGRVTSSDTDKEDDKNVDDKLKNEASKKEIKKALSNYKNFLIKRYKANKNLVGYVNPAIPEDIIKTVEVGLDDVKGLGDIINLLSPDKLLEDENLDEKKYWL